MPLDGLRAMRLSTLTRLSFMAHVALQAAAAAAAAALSDQSASCAFLCVQDGEALHTRTCAGFAEIAREDFTLCPQLPAHTTGGYSMVWSQRACCRAARSLSPSSRHGGPPSGYRVLYEARNATFAGESLRAPLYLTYTSAYNL